MMRKLARHIKGRLPLYFLLAPIFLLAAAIALCVGAVQCSVSHPDVGENVESVEWLPQAARNVSYWRTSPVTAFEFDIDEDGFKAWAKKWELKPIESPHRIERYQLFLRGDAEAYATVSKGLCHLTRRRNGGGVHVVYDSERKRAYYRSSSR